MLHQHGFEVHAAAHNNLESKPGLKLDFVDRLIEVPFVRSVSDPKNAAAYRAIKKVIDSDDYEVIHCNTPIASVLTRLAARGARKRGTKVFYTAHGFQVFTFEQEGLAHLLSSLRVLPFRNAGGGAIRGG